MFANRSEKQDHEELMEVVSNMSIAEPPCWSYPEAFFEPEDKPKLQQRGLSAEQVIAISLCNGCEAKFACAGYAMKWMPKGVWGGTTESSRARQRAIRNRDAA